jgi:hypothetical protein
MQEQVTVMLLPTLRPQWLGSIYVVRVTPLATKQLRASKLTPSALPRPLVSKFSRGILRLATGHFLVTSVYQNRLTMRVRARWSVSGDECAEMAVYCDFRF